MPIHNNLQNDNPFNSLESLNHNRIFLKRDEYNKTIDDDLILNEIKSLREEINTLHQKIKFADSVLLSLLKNHSIKEIESLFDFFSLDDWQKAENGIELKMFGYNKSS